MAIIRQHTLHVLQYEDTTGGGWSVFLQTKTIEGEVTNNMTLPLKSFTAMGFPSIRWNDPPGIHRAAEEADKWARQVAFQLGAQVHIIPLHSPVE